MRHVLFTLLVVPSFFAVVQGQQVPVCRNWQECRQLALDASMRGEYEHFHDLAWRVVQTGPRDDSAQMYLLARAQVLNGRPHDALVMLKRLADMGVATDAVTDADFRRTRELPGWQEVAAAIARAGTATLTPLVEPEREGTRSTAAPGGSVPVVLPSQPGTRRTSPAGAASPGGVVIAPPATIPFPIDPAPMSEAVRFSTGKFLAAGLAYDAVSRRFVIGDVLGRRLIVVGVGSNHAEDLVRADSAGFGDVVALDIDEKSGDLWVASATDTNGESALHRLQLVSGRPRQTYRAGPFVGSARLVDLAVQRSGGVIALDSSGSRLLQLARGDSDTTVAMSLKLSGAKSVAARDTSVLYVAHDDGIARGDLDSRTVAALSAPRGFDLRRFDVIRAHRNALIGLQTTPEGLRQLVRLDLNQAGRAVREGTVIDPRVAETDGRLSLTITGDEVYYLATEAASAGPPPPSNRSSLAERFVIRRLTLRWTEARARSAGRKYPLLIPADGDRGVWMVVPAPIVPESPESTRRGHNSHCRRLQSRGRSCCPSVRSSGHDATDQRRRIEHRHHRGAAHTLHARQSGPIGLRGATRNLERDSSKVVHEWLIGD